MPWRQSTIQFLERWGFGCISLAFICNATETATMAMAALLYSMYGTSSTVLVIAQVQYGRVPNAIGKCS